MKRRSILHLHLDVDAFFASVEEILDPSLKGKPGIIGARPEQRGVEAGAVEPGRGSHPGEAWRRGDTAGFVVSAQPNGVVGGDFASQ